MKSKAGLIGLGVMGKSLALNMAGKIESLSVFNRMAPGEENVVTDFLQTAGSNVSGYTDLKEFVESIESPRRIIMMIPAGNAVDQMIEQLGGLLQEGDVLADGGNSYFADSNRRQSLLADKGVGFLGMGISGGEEGALKGPAIMPGGNKEHYDLFEPILNSIAAKDRNSFPCSGYIGNGGSGHFVKMIHNGIEYAEMQLLAECYDLLRSNHSNEQIADLLQSWNEGEASSFLLEISSAIFRVKEGENYLVDLILDKAGNKGTGGWSSKVGLDLGTVNTMMASSVFARYISALKSQRIEWSRNFDASKSNVSPADLLEAYQMARMINHFEGLEVIRKASEEYEWGVNLSDVARIWTNGCIIRSKLMEDISQMDLSRDSLLDDSNTLEWLKDKEGALGNVLKCGIDSRVALPSFSAAFTTWVGLTTERSPANLIQAQRDFFGAHRYQRTDSGDAYFHTIWN